MLKREIRFDVTKYKQELEESPYFKTKGVITFSPVRKGLKSKAACCVIEVDEQIIDYYRHQLYKQYGLKLQKPSWSAHISIIQGSCDTESEIYQQLIKDYEGKEVQVEYSIFPRFSGDTGSVADGKEHGLFWFLTVYSDEFYEIRNKLGLITNFKPHLTIAKKLNK